MAGGSTAPGRAGRHAPNAGFCAQARASFAAAALACAGLVAGVAIVALSLV